MKISISSPRDFNQPRTFNKTAEEIWTAISEADVCARIANVDTHNEDRKPPHLGGNEIRLDMDAASPNADHLADNEILLAVGVANHNEDRLPQDIKRTKMRARAASDKPSSCCGAASSSITK